jgi:hypothetical protein
MTPPEGAGDDQEYDQSGQPPAGAVEIGVDRHRAPGTDVLGLRQLQVGQFDVLRIVGSRTTGSRVGGSPQGIISPVDDLPAFPGLTRTTLSGTGLTGTGLTGTGLTRTALSGTAFRCRGLRGEVSRAQILTVELVQCGDVPGDGFFLVEAKILGVGANEAFVEDAARELVEVLLFDGAEHARADLGGVGNVLELDALPLTRFTEFVAELSHAVPQSDPSTVPPTKIIIGQGRRLRHSWRRGNGVLAVTEVRGQVVEANGWVELHSYS